ncbi:hypothetical protein Tco_0331433 [Tanacetum coccineum]
MEKMENENVSLEFQVQSLNKEIANVKNEYQKLFDSIKKTRTQTQKEIHELIESVNQKTCAYGDVRSQNQDLLITISELKAKLKTDENGKSVNTKFDKPSISDKPICVTPMNKNVVQKKRFVSKTEEKQVIQIILWIVDSGCSKHMTGNLKLLRNFVKKFMGTILFGNAYFAAITGYKYYVHDNVTICHVYYVEGLGHNLFLVGQFCDSDLEVAFRSTTCYVRNLEGEDLLTGDRDSNLYTISISDMAASSPMKMKPKAGIEIFIDYSESSRWFRIYNRRTRKIIETIHVKFDELTTVASEHSCLEPESNRFNVENSSAESIQTPLKEDLADLFSPLYEEYYEKRSREVSTNSVAPINLNNEDTPSSSTIIVDDNEAPPLVSTSEEQTSPISNDVAEE